MVAKEEKLTVKDVKARTDGNEMDLSLLQIETVPVKVIASVSKADSIDLSCNRIMHLPDDFCTLLHYLIKLDLSKNKLFELPEDIFHLQHLKQLDLFQNDLRTLPLGFSKLKNLKWLDLKDNPLEPDYAKFVGDCLDDKQCRQCAIDVVSNMKAMSDDHEQEKMKKLKKAKKREAQKSAKERKMAEIKKQEKKQEKERRRKEWEEEQRAMAELLKSRNIGCEESTNDLKSKPESNQGLTESKRGHKFAWILCILVLFLSVAVGMYFVYCDGKAKSKLCGDINLKLQQVRLTCKEYSESAVKVYDFLVGFGHKCATNTKQQLSSVSGKLHLWLDKIRSS